MRTIGLSSVLITFITVFTLATLTVRAGEQNENSVAQIPEQFADIWLIYDMANATKWAAMTLNDDTLTTSIDNVLTGSVSQSRRREPLNWATFDLNDNGEQLVVLFPKWRAPRQYFISDKSVHIDENFRLDGCFLVDKQSQMLSQSDGLVKPAHLCFSPTGKFKTKSLGLCQSGSMFLGASYDDVQHGSYTIDKHLITFTCADGAQMKTILGAYRFGERAPTLSAISIGELVFFRDTQV